ncbi:lantibiotic dehydratase [Streptomyces caelestis]|uniref:lantibiotic dehydratase n=1 Tax=Streptomyces caelestis TaxID=36816 RepID=UPI003652106A
MPHTASADTPPGHDSYLVDSAPYALVRATVLTCPAQSPATAAFRAALAHLTSLEVALRALREPLCDDLYASRSGHGEQYHRDVVLPLRRALHNGREPRPAVLDRLDDLPRRVPRLASWLELRDRRRALMAELGGAAEPALAAERAALAALCREPALARAVALTSGDLLRAVERAGRRADDRKARKEEPTVLRHALRAGTKTSPFSWFTAVGWGRPTPPRAGRPRVRSWGEQPLLDGPLHASVKVNRTLTTALAEALLADPRHGAGLPHRVTSTARVSEGRATYARDRVAFAGGRYLVTDEDAAEVAFNGSLRLLAPYAGAPAPLDEMAELLASALPGAPDTNRAAALAFLERLRQAGLLVPTSPVPPQDPDPAGRLAAWLRTLPGVGEQGPEAAGRLADRLAELSRETSAFASAPAPRRPALLAGLADGWTRLLADAGRPVPTGSAPLNVLSEDVVAPRPVPLDGFLDGADHEALGEVTALAELFDLAHVMRRAARDRFVERYGAGGSCPHPWEFGAEVEEAWERAARVTVPGRDDPAGFPTGVGALMALRAELTDAVRSAAAGSPDGTEVLLPADAVKGLGERLPRWAVERPLSYAYFLQRDPDGGMLCVNRVYGGWGRFTSRFLDALDPDAAEDVAAQLRRGLGPGARAAQMRPVGGFNANLHPLLVPDDIGPDRRWTSLAEADVELFHDEAGDQVRFRVTATGEPLDVLYPGFLAPLMLPRRIAALLSDHPHGVVDFRSLPPRHSVDAPGGEVVLAPRLRHRHVVLNRRRWTLPAGVVRALHAELTAAPGTPVEPVAHWRALLGLPDQVFLHPAPTVPTGRVTEDFLAHLRRPKPQFVDLGNPLHLRCLAKWLSRHPGGAVLEEALPAPGGSAVPTRAVELVTETYRAGRSR